MNWGEWTEVSGELLRHIGFLFIGLQVTHHHLEHCLLLLVGFHFLLQHFAVKIQFLVFVLENFQLVFGTEGNLVGTELEGSDLPLNVLVV